MKINPSAVVSRFYARYYLHLFKPRATRYSDLTSDARDRNKHTVSKGNRPSNCKLLRNFLRVYKLYALGVSNYCLTELTW